MSTVSSRSDRFSGLRRFVARGVVVVYLFLVISVVLTVVSSDRSVLGDSGLWTAWIIAAVPLTAGFAVALRVLSAADRGRSRRLTTIAAALLLVGLAIILADTIGAL
jgi:hypothetical protein